MVSLAFCGPVGSANREHCKSLEGGRSGRLEVSLRPLTASCELARGPGPLRGPSPLVSVFPPHWLLCSLGHGVVSSSPFTKVSSNCLL